MISQSIDVIVLIVFASTQIIVGKRWPPPRWFFSDNAPPGFDQVIANGDDVVADGDDVIVPE